MFAVFGIGKEADEGHTEVREEQREGWNVEEEYLERRIRERLEERLWLTSELDIVEPDLDWETVSVNLTRWTVTRKNSSDY